MLLSRLRVLYFRQVMEAQMELALLNQFIKVVECLLEAYRIIALARLEEWTQALVVFSMFQVVRPQQGSVAVGEHIGLDVRLLMDEKGRRVYEPDADLATRVARLAVHGLAFDNTDSQLTVRCFKPVSDQRNIASVL